MDYILRTFGIGIAVFGIEVMMYNFLMVDKLPKWPGDFYYDRNGWRIYIPVASAILISIVLTILLGRFQ